MHLAYNIENHIQMKKIIVPLVSVAFYFCIYVTVVLLKPPQYDQIRQAYRLTYSTLQTINHHLHLENISSQTQIQNEVDCLFNRSEVASIVQNTIYKKMGFKDEERGKSQAVYRVFDGLFTHFELLSHKNDINNESLLHVYDNEQLGNNLMLVYQITAKTIKKILQQNNITANPNFFENNLVASQLLTNISIVLKNATFDNYENYLVSMFKNQQILIVYQNASNLIQAINEKKCRNMQLETFTSILQCQYTHRVNYTNTEVIELLSFFESISQSLQIYYRHKNVEVKLYHMRSWFDHGHIYTFIIGLGAVIIYMFLQINIDKKVKRSFRHTFPKDRRFKIE